jgi:glycosyltransferase involved in cell wall biosynthesis
LVAVHQFLPSLGPRDAVGNHVVGTWRALRRAGVAGGIWAEYVHPDLRHGARRYRGYPGRLSRLRDRRRVMLYQVSTGSDGLARFLVDRVEPLAVCYHNITPPELLEHYDSVAARQSRLGREQLRLLLPRAASVIADSEFNACELRGLGVADVAVVPPYTGPRLAAPDGEYRRHLETGKRGIDLLFVGRIMPHKGHLHLLRAVAALRANTGAPVRLFLVGVNGPRSFMSALLRVSERLGLEDSVILTGSLPDDRLAAHYAAADVFLCLSEHEGFGIPVLEAMRTGLPVLAYDAGAVGETLGGCGILLGTLDPLVVAEVVSRVSADEALRGQLRLRQQARAAELDGFDRDAALLAVLRPLLEG